MVTYQPSLNCRSRINKENLNILYMSSEAKAVFSPGPMVSFKSACKISSYFVKAKLYPLQRFVGWRQYKKRRCKVCTNVTETDTVSSTVTGETFQINYELNCDDKCLISLLKTVCRKNNGCVPSKVEQLHAQWQKISEKWKLHATTSLWAFL